MLKIGLIIPRPARPARNEKAHSPMTTTPAEAKKSGAWRDFENETELKERRAKTGSVPIANVNIMSEPERNDPLASEATCIDWVKPQGRKNVVTPIRIGANAVSSTFWNHKNMAFGRVSEFLLSTPTRFNPSTIITNELAIPRRAEKVKLTQRLFPRSQRSPPRRVNPRIRPVWKRMIDRLLFFASSWEAFAESERTSPHTTARQLDTDATSPMRKLESGLIFPQIQKLSIPDFWSMKNQRRNKSHIGRAVKRFSVSYAICFCIFFSERVYPRGLSFVLRLLIIGTRFLLSDSNVTFCCSRLAFTRWISHSFMSVLSIIISQEAQCIPET